MIWIRKFLTTIQMFSYKYISWLLPPLFSHLHVNFMFLFELHIRRYSKCVWVHLSKGFNLLFFIWADMIIREWAELLGFEKRKPNTIVTILDGGLHCVDYLMPTNRNRSPFSNFLTHDLPKLTCHFIFSD